MDVQSPDQIKQEMIQKMGIDFGSLFYSLFNEITWITFKWVEYKELFGVKESRIQLMNESAPFLFFIIQEVLWDDLILGISRITDPVKTNNNKNLTLLAIPKHLSDAVFKKEIENDLAELDAAARFCRVLRNKTIAHNDYDLLTQGKDVKPLDPGNRKQIELIIEKIQSIFNKIKYHYFGSTTIFQFVRCYNGALSLLHIVEQGLEYSKERFRAKKLGSHLERTHQSKV